MAKKLVTCLLILIVLQMIIFIDIASAHRIYITEQEPGKLLVSYDGNVAASRAVITLYDADENILLQEQVNKDGVLLYDHRKIKATKAISDDGLGHRTTFNIVKGNVEEVPIFYKIILGLSFLAFIAAYFQYRNNQVSTKTKQDALQ